MSNVVPTTDGAVVTSDMSPLEIFNAHLAARGQPAYDPRSSAPSLAGPAGHPWTTVDSEETARAMVAPPTTTSRTPPNPQELEASRNARISEFDAEMRAAGLQKSPQARDEQGRFVQDGTRPNVEIDRGAIAQLQREYAALTPQEREAERADFEQALAILYDGGRLVVDGESPAGEPQESTMYAQTDDWQQHVVDGQIDVSKLTLAHTANYRIPVFVKDQTLTVAAIDQLRQARAAGFTQQQVDSYFRQEAIKLGWIRS